MGLWLKSVEDLRGSNLRRIEWSKTWLWDIRFSDPNNDVNPLPPLFSEWFPATTCSVQVYNLEAKDFESPLAAFSIPLKDSTVKVITLNFTDDISLSIEKWLDNWVNVEIKGKGKYISCVDDIVKQVDIAKLKNAKVQDGKLASVNETLGISSYWVFPKGSLFFDGTSDTGVHSSSLELVVAGIISDNPRL